MPFVSDLLDEFREIDVVVIWRLLGWIIKLYSKPIKKLEEKLIWHTYCSSIKMHFIDIYLCQNKSDIMLMLNLKQIQYIFLKHKNVGPSTHVRKFYPSYCNHNVLLQSEWI